MRRRVTGFLVALVVATVSIVAWPSPDWVPVPIQGLKMRCFEETKPVPWSFCIHQVPGSTNRDVVYHFHGRNGAATWWNDETYYSREVMDFWAEARVAPPTVVGVSFGALWILTDTPEGLLPVFTNDVIPKVEAQLGKPIARRMLVGESMGGLNALVIGLKTTGTFSRIAALCPPLPTLSPNASISDKVAYVRRTSTTWRRAALMQWLSDRFYPTEADWLSNHPFPLSQQPNALLGTEFYLSCGARDEWGCQEGAEAVVTNLERHGNKVEWHLQPGGHCDIDSRSLAQFLGAPAGQHTSRAPTESTPWQPPP